MTNVEKIKETILTLREEYILRKNIPGFAEINNGQCEDFAYFVLKQLQQASNDFNDAFVIGIDNLFIEDTDLFDVNLLENHWNISPPNGHTWDSLNKINLGLHVWLTFDKRHYDSECPEGVDSFFELPFYKRWLLTA